jgi:hypothetical protein
MKNVPENIFSYIAVALILWLGMRGLFYASKKRR